MAKFECSVCGYIFDEQQAGIKFSEVTECPICAESKDCFKQLEEEKKEDKSSKGEDKGFVIEKRQEFWLEEKDKEVEVDKSNIETYYEGAKPVKSLEQLEREKKEREEKERPRLDPIDGGGAVKTVIDGGDRSSDGSDSEVVVVEEATSDVDTGDDEKKEEKKEEEKKEESAEAVAETGAEAVAETGAEAVAETGAEAVTETGAETAKEEKTETAKEEKAEDGAKAPAEEKTAVAKEKSRNGRTFFDEEEARAAKEKKPMESIAWEPIDRHPPKKDKKVENKPDFKIEENDEDFVFEEVVSDKPLETQEIPSAVSAGIHEEGDFFTGFDKSPVFGDKVRSEEFIFDDEEPVGEVVELDVEPDKAEDVAEEPAEEKAEEAAEEPAEEKAEEVTEEAEKAEEAAEETEKAEEVTEEAEKAEEVTEEAEKAEEVTEEAEKVEEAAEEAEKVEEAAEEAEKVEEAAEEAEKAEEVAEETSVEDETAILAAAAVAAAVAEAEEKAEEAAEEVEETAEEETVEETAEETVEEPVEEVAEETEEAVEETEEVEEASEETASEDVIGTGFVMEDKKYLLADEGTKSLFVLSGVGPASNGLEGIILLPAQLDPMPMSRDENIRSSVVLGQCTERPIRLERPFGSSDMFVWGEYIPGEEDASHYENATLILVRGKNSHIPNVSGKEELRKVVSAVKEETEYSIPVGISLVIGRIEQDLAACAYAGVDFVVLNDVSSGMLPYALRRAKNYLSRVNSEIELIVSIKDVNDAKEMAKLIALGADFILIEREYDEITIERLTNDLKEIARNTGHKYVHDLNMTDICTIDSDLAKNTDIAHF